MRELLQPVIAGVAGQAEAAPEPSRGLLRAPTERVVRLLCRDRTRGFTGERFRRA
jgi:hypothetical protein